MPDTCDALILGGGLYPQPGIRSRHDAAEALLAEREAHGKRATRVADYEPATGVADAGEANARH